MNGDLRRICIYMNGDLRRICIYMNGDLRGYLYLHEYINTAIIKIRIMT